MDRGGTEERRGLFGNALVSHFEIVGVDFVSDAISSPLCGGDRGCSRAHEGVEDRIANEAEHADQPFGELDGIRSGVLFC